MPSRQLVERFLDMSLAPSEDPDDFLKMTDMLIAKRDDRNPHLTEVGPMSELGLSMNEEVAAFLLCWLIHPKPRAYVSAMHGFRLQFRGIHGDAGLVRNFKDSISDEALELSSWVQADMNHPERYFRNFRARGKLRRNA